MKHAYLIIAHSEFEVLERLLRALDDVRNDIYIHFDSKVKKMPVVKTRNAGLFVLDKRINVCWGDVSIIEAEYALFEAASKRQSYAFYHLLSGVDMPLKSQDYIHRFFDENKDKEFVGFFQGDYDKLMDRKMNHYHIFSKDLRPRRDLANQIRKAIRFGFLSLQFLVGYRRNQGIPFRKGTQWVSISDDFVRYIIARKQEVLDTYHHTYCADEVFLHTLCWNSPFKDRLFDATDEGHGCMRMIRWENNLLVNWQMGDFSRLMSSDALFARKFTGRHLDVVDEILKTITGKS